MRAIAITLRLALTAALAVGLVAASGSALSAQDGVPGGAADTSGEVDELAPEGASPTDDDDPEVTVEAPLGTPPSAGDPSSDTLVQVPAAPPAAPVRAATAAASVSGGDEALREPPLTLPRPIVERPLTLPQLVFRLGARTIASGVQDAFSDYTVYGTVVGDVSIGLLDDLEVGVVYAPVQLVPELHYLGPSVVLVGRFLSGVVDMGASLTVHVPVEDEGGSVSAALGMPVLVHAARWLRLDFVPQLGMQADNPMVLSASVPLTATFQIVPAVFAGAKLGLEFVGIEGFDDAFLSASAFFGGTVSRSRGPTADLSVAFTLPSVTDGLQSFSVLLAANFYLYAR